MTNVMGRIICVIVRGPWYSCVLVYLYTCKHCYGFFTWFEFVVFEAPENNTSELLGIKMGSGYELFLLSFLISGPASIVKNHSPSLNISFISYLK